MPPPLPAEQKTQLLGGKKKEQIASLKAQMEDEKKEMKRLSHLKNVDVALKRLTKENKKLVSELSRNVFVIVQNTLNSF